MKGDLTRLHSIQTDLAPRPAGHYAQATSYKDMLYVSGQLQIDPKSGNVVEGGIEAQAGCVLRNLAAVLAAAGSNLQCVVKATVYLSDINDWGIVDGIFAKAFGAHRPARSMIPAGRLHRDALIEVDAIAIVL